MMVVVDLYGRVSTAEQVNGYSLGEQEQRLRKYAEAQGWIVHGCYMDGGFTGSNLMRTGIQAVIHDAQQHKINKVIVFKLDRLSRSQKDTLYLIQDVFRKNDVDFVSMTESFDTSSPFGIATLGVMSAFSELEKENIKLRMTIGRDARVKDGFYHGGGHIPIGFTYSDGKLHVDEYDAMILRSIYESYADGMTASAIAKMLNEDVKWRTASWTSSKVTRLLTQPLYIGLQRWKNETISVKDCPILIDAELWERVQKEIARRTAKAPKSQTAYHHNALLGGLLFCGYCGKRYNGYQDRGRDGHKIHRYYCYGRTLHNHDKRTPICSNRGWKDDELDSIVLDQVSKLSSSRSITADMAAAGKHQDDDIKAINSRIKQLDYQIDKLIELYSLGKIDASLISDKSDMLKAEKEKLLQQIEDIKKPTNCMSISELSNALDTFDDLVKSCSDRMELYTIIHQLIKSITLTGDDIDIVWNIKA